MIFGGESFTASEDVSREIDELLCVRGVLQVVACEDERLGDRTIRLHLTIMFQTTLDQPKAFFSARFKAALRPLAIEK